MAKRSFKRKLYLTIAASSLIFRNWTIRKKFYIGFLSLILVLTSNVVLTTYEITALNGAQSKLPYLVYLDVVGIITGCLFIWIISQSVLRPMRRIINHLENKKSFEEFHAYNNDEIGQLAKAISLMKKNVLPTDQLDEKKMLMDAVLQLSLESIFIFNQEGSLTSFSKGFKNITTYLDEEIKKMHVSQIISNLDLKQVFDELSKDDVNAPFCMQRVILKSKKGKECAYNCSICKVQGIDHAVYIGILREIQTSALIKEKFQKAFSSFSKK